MPLEVNQDVPWNSVVMLAPVAPAGVQANLPIAQKDLLHERFKSMKASKFEGLLHPGMVIAKNFLY